MSHFLLKIRGRISRTPRKFLQANKYSSQINKDIKIVGAAQQFFVKGERNNQPVALEMNAAIDANCPATAGADQRFLPWKR